LLLCAVALGSAGPRAQQAQPPPSPAAAAQIQSLARGWAELAAGNTVAAAGFAEQVLNEDPRNVAALALAVEAEIVRAGAMAGLSRYERWLGARTLEEAYSLRRIALAHLRGAARDPGTRLPALKALMQDGDADAAGQLAAGSASGNLADTVTLASLGDEAAVRSLVTRLPATPGNKKLLIEALAQSHSQAAIPPLVQLLDGFNDDTKAFAADALGTLGAVQAIDKLRPFLDSKWPPMLRFQAAGALARMGDPSGLAYLRTMFNDPQSPPMIVVTAAEPLALATGRDGGWMEKLRRYLNDPNPQVRMQAAGVIAKYDRPIAQATLDALALDPNIAVREAATDVLARWVAADLTTLRRLLRTGDAQVKISASGRILEMTR
jgi:HEAT repeat protein